MIADYLLPLVPSHTHTHTRVHSWHENIDTLGEKVRNCILDNLAFLVKIRNALEITAKAGIIELWFFPTKRVVQKAWILGRKRKKLRKKECLSKTERNFKRGLREKQNATLIVRKSVYMCV